MATITFQGRDGELRLSDATTGGSSGPYHVSLLFVNMDFSAGIKRPRAEDTLILNRNVFDNEAHYVQGPDSDRLVPLPLTFSCRLADTSHTRIIADWVSGVTIVNGTTVLTSYDGTTLVDGVSIPAFADGAKQSYRVEVLWDGTNDLGYKFDEVYFPPDQQTITEAEDGLTLNVNAQVYGNVTRMTAFTSTTAVA